MTEIAKTTYTFTVLHPADAPPDGLMDALQEATEGNAVGDVTGIVTVAVPRSRVRDELQELGNDGEFFDDDDNE